MLLIKFPSRSRADKFFACIENIQSMIGISDYVIAAALDLDDGTMNNFKVKERLKKYDNLIVYWGLSGSKIAAINRSIPMTTDWDHLLVTSDDFWYQENFGRRILYDFQELAPDGDALLHYPDGHVNEKLVTLPVMGRKYYDRFGYVFHPSYNSVKCDKEQMIVAKRLNKYHFIDVRIAEHRHPRWTKEQKDDQLKQQDSPKNYAKDGLNFLTRQKNNFA